ENQRSSKEAVQRYEEIAEAAQARLQTLDKPVLAMIRGYCLGAGVNIANVCDLRIAGDDARFGIPAAKMGLGYRASSMKNLVDTVGAPYAREIMITGRQFSAQEAKDMGLVHHVVPVADLELFTREYWARIVAKTMGENLGQQVVVENRAGAGGNIAVDYVAKSAPDGYTVVLANVGALAVNPHLLKVPYDPLRDLTPLTMAVVFANVLVVQPSLAVSSLADYVKLAREKPATVTYASSGIGGAGHL